MEAVEKTDVIIQISGLNETCSTANVERVLSGDWPDSEVATLHEIQLKCNSYLFRFWYVDYFLLYGTTFPSKWKSILTGMISFVYKLFCSNMQYLQRNTSRRIIFLPTYFYISWTNYLTREETLLRGRRENQCIVKIILVIGSRYEHKLYFVLLLFL